MYIEESREKTGKTTGFLPLKSADGMDLTVIPCYYTLPGVRYTKYTKSSF